MSPTSTAPAPVSLWGLPVPGNRWDRLDGLQPARPPMVSVIVLHFEQPEELARTLGALDRQSYPRLEVIVVDDGSAEEPVVPAGVRLVRQDDHGFRAAAARNAGARVASGDVLCFLDADTAPEPGYVAALSRLPALCGDAVTVGRRRHAAFEGPRPGDHGTGDDEPVELAGPRHELPAPSWLADAYAASHDLLEADHRSYRYVISSVLACSRPFFEATGGFDERFDRYGGEDWEWANRAWMLGAVLAHVPSAVAWHAGPDLAGRLAPDELRARQNAEALVLLDRVGVPRSSERVRSGGLRSGAPDVVIDLPGGSTAAVAVSADLLLEALPSAVIVVNDRHAEALGGDTRVRGRTAASAALRMRARVTIDCSEPFTVPRAERIAFATQLADATERVGVGELGWIEIAPLDEETAGPRVRVVAARSEHRRIRRPRDHGFTTESWIAPLRAIDGEPDLAAHLAGWAP